MRRMGFLREPDFCNCSATSGILVLKVKPITPEEALGWVRSAL